jgi:hypothetical protein
MKKNEQIALRLQWALHPALLPAALLATVLSVTACGGGSQSNAPTTPVATVVAATPVVLQASPPGAWGSGDFEGKSSLLQAIGEVDISKMRFDLKSRDDIPKILRGLQFIYTNLALRTLIFALLDANISPEVSKTNGRPGMTLWSILVCGVIRLDLNCDYDRLQELVNHHNTLREMLGHGAFDDVTYHFQTLKDNVRLLTPELLDQINQLVVAAGHILVKKSPDEALRGRCDSFVLETHVHYPTDINLLWDAMRKSITLTAQWCDERGMSDWRQSLLRQVKQVDQIEKNQLLIQAHQTYQLKATSTKSARHATITAQGLGNPLDLRICTAKAQRTG